MLDQHATNPFSYRSGVVGVGDYVLDGQIPIDTKLPTSINRGYRERAGGGAYNAVLAYSQISARRGSGPESMIDMDFPARIISTVGGSLLDGARDQDANRLMMLGGTEVVPDLN